MEKREYITKVDVDGEEFVVRCYLDECPEEGAVLIAESSQFKIVFSYAVGMGMKVYCTLGPNSIELKKVHGEIDEYEALLRKAYKAGEMLHREEIIEWFIES